MLLDRDDFTLFGLPPRFELDEADLASRRRTLQAEVHPDRFAAEGAAAQRAAMQWAVRVNEAYRRLQDPLKRAAYLCELHGAPIGAEDNTAMPPEFLIQQMAWREALDDAQTCAQVEAIGHRIDVHRSEAYAELARSLDESADFAQAARQVRALMFVERFADDIEQRLESLEG
ncbi:MAG TPA: Fe-S protein assembly co-chaperone HscB [Caldimonas sp.]|jgi:molecular chaperone HscB|nr:Fe-S protein assembly co-chaperone HscB [Caldimonas sp.]